MHNYYVANQKHALIISFKIETKKTKEVRKKLIGLWSYDDDDDELWKHKKKRRH